MEATGEAITKLVENITSERVETTNESYESTSVESKIVEENRTATYESTQEIITIGDNPSAENNTHCESIDEASNNVEANKSETETNIENSTGDTVQQINNIAEDVIKNEPAENQERVSISEVVNEVEDNTEAIADVVAEDICSTQEHQENVVLEEQLPQEKQKEESSEFVSEYMLENQTENVYMPEQELGKVELAPEDVYSTEMISDDSHDNSAALGQQSEQQTSVVIEEITEINEGNVESQLEPGHQEEDEVLPFIEEPPEVEQSECDLGNTGQDSVKAESADNADKYDNVSEVDNQSVDESISNEPSTSEPVVMEEVLQDRTEDRQVYLVKEEVQALGVHENHPVEADVQEMEDQPEEQEEMDVNNELIENVEVVNVPSSENESLQNFTLPEGLEVTDIQEDYTLVEDSTPLDISSTQQGMVTNSDGTLVLLQNFENSEDNNLMQMSEEQQEIYLAELRNQAESRQSTSSQSLECRPRRGRKPTFDIPMHVLGHDISKPVETVPNGRALPKPRLGVKVPYRNLTSQIVSKAEIEKEIMERARLKQEQANARGDVLFARKLTQRLARKIAPSPNYSKRNVVGAGKPKESEAQPETKEPETTTTERDESGDAQAQDSTIIHNDSDLLAILEGEGEEMPVLPKEMPQTNADETNLKMLEREIALQQLQELPHQAPKQRVFKGRQSKFDVKAPVLTAEAKAKPAEKTSVAKETATSARAVEPQNSVAKQKTESPRALSDKENTSKRSVSKETSLVSPKKEATRIDLPPSPVKQPVEIEPQVKVNMVLKTYSRKRKTIELPEPFPESPVAKKSMLCDSDIKVEKSDAYVPPDVYVTKSSRVIKRKVIWDPDEIPARSPKPSSKIESQTPKVTPVKPPKPVDKSSEKIVEKKPTTEKVIKEKPPEKKVVEKHIVKKTVNEKSTPTEKKPTKSDSPKTPGGKTPVKNKKKTSEVDKLLMDEGAVKMLYELKTNDDVAPSKKKKDVYSVERAQKEIIKKANEIKSDLEQNTGNEAPKSLRKKETFTPSPVKAAQIVGIERKMSKDSTRSSLHTPPGSPPYSFPHSQSSMLIRRRSSSSISSSDDVSTDDGTKVSRKRSVGDTPRPKKTKKVEDVEEPAEPEEPVKEPPPKPATTAENKLNQFKSFTVKKTSKHVAMDLNYTNEKCYCTVQVLEELTTALKKYAKDKDCNVVSITSSSKAFCLGLDYASLISDKDDVRKKNATELAGRVRDFLLCLLNFPKVLIAGIQGDCVGLGATMLPLFDMVIASDTATFSTPYASMGCVAEAGFLLSSPHLTNQGLAAELLFTTQKLTADDAFRRGLISRLCWPEKYNETLKNIVTSISKGSKQSLEATKKQLRRHVVQTTEAAINSESKLLIEQWTSAECQKSFAKLIEDSN